MRWNIPQLMGVVNVTPDSFSDGGAFLDFDAAIAHGVALVEQGADIIDIGGESTRPGAEAVDTTEEISRTIPIVERLSRLVDVPISIDTRKPAVAQAAIAAGASIWNDVSALSYDADSLRVAAALECRIVLMHAQGDPKTMQADPRYDDVIAEVGAYLKDRIDACIAAGVARRRLIVDPGVGFGKTLGHNLALIAGLSEFGQLGAPILLGASRKRFIAALDREGPARERLGGSVAAAIEGARRGAAIVRVHDVAATRQALKVAFAIENAEFIR